MPRKLDSAAWLRAPAAVRRTQRASRSAARAGPRSRPKRPAREVRKTVTVVFSDVTGSTALGEQLDPESLRRVMGRYFDEMQSVVERHGGIVEKFIGDAVMAVFGIPVVHEDDALRAVRAAVEMRERLSALNEELARDWGVTIAVRTGVNTGEVVAGDAGGGQRFATGDAVNVAKRFEEAAPPGEILLGEPTYRLVRDAVEVEEVEPLGLKGKTAPVGAYRLLSLEGDVPGRARRLDSPMVGRERELAALEQAYRASSGRARVPAVHAARRRGCRQVEARRRVPGRRRRRGHDHARPLPSVRRGHHLLAAGRGSPRALRRRSAGRHRRRSRGGRRAPDHRASRGRGRPRGRSGPERRDRLGRPPALRGGGPRSAAGRPVRRPAVGRADVSRPRRAPGGLVARRADPAHLHRPPRVPRRASELGRRQVQRHLRAPRASERRRIGRARRRISSDAPSWTRTSEAGS